MGTLSVILFCSVLVSCYGTPAPAVYDTIVIGMGASGTAAATTLAKAGQKVLALEAQNRIGGRVNTVPFGDGIVELGAEWIHGTENSSSYELAIKNNVSLLPHDTDFKVYRSDGSSDKEDIVIALMNYTWDVVEDPPENPEPLGQYITRRIRDYIKEKYPSVQNDTDFINNCLHFLELFMKTYESSNSWNDVTTLSDYENLGGHQAISWHTYGYKTLFEILLNKYKNGPGYPMLEIKLNTEVTKIQWPQDPNDNVVVTTKDGSTYTAKNVIVTLSVGVLKERYQTLFSPPLSDQKITPIKAISIGICDKIVFRFGQRWWQPNTYFFFVWREADRATVSEADRWTLSIDGASEPLSMAKTCLTLWTCGDDAKTVETLPDDVVRTKIMELIRRFMGTDTNTTIPEPIEMLRSSWYSNPFTRGSYSFDNVETPLHPTVRADLGKPLVDSSGAPRVLFAGEATETSHFATVHGAIESGRREANRLLSSGKN